MTFKNILIYIFVVCQFGFIWSKGGYTTASDGIYCVHLQSTMDLSAYNKKFPVNKSNNNNYGIRFEVNEEGKTPIRYYNAGHFIGGGTFLNDDERDRYFKEAYQNSSIENEILNYHECYVSPNFLSYARTLPHYNEHIFDLQKRIKNGEKFIVNGFNESFKFGKKKNKFHNFINDEANRIKEFQDKVNKASEVELKKHKENQNKQNQFPRLHFSSTKEIDTFAEYCEVRSRWSYDSEDEFANTRLDARKRALEETDEHNGECYDYSSEVRHYKFDDPSADVFNNCYGTALDRQLHEELCETRAEMQDLELVDVNNIHVVAFAPIVYQATAQAKTEKNAIKAFTLSDFACDLVRIVKGGIRIMTLAVNDPSIAARGIAIGVKTFLTPKHWIDFASGTLKMITLFIDEDARQDSLDNSCITSAILGKPDLFLEECDEYVQHCEAQKQALRLKINKTAAKLKNMSDEEFIEGFFKHGTIFVLDLIAFNAAALATTYEGRVLISQYAEGLSSPAAEQVAFEAAGIGKISLEEGIDAANMALEIVEKNPKLIKTEGSLFDAAKKVVNVANERGKAFENFLEKQLGGRGSFKVKGKYNSREFDGAIGNVWYEAKSGRYWERTMSFKQNINDFKADIIRGLDIAKENGAIYELYSELPIPKEIQDWLTKQGVKFKEFEEFTKIWEGK